MSADEKRLRENRRRNLDDLLANEVTTRQQLARQLKAELNYISQLRHGHRPISEATARDIETFVGLPHRSLDDPPMKRLEPSVSQLTDKEIVDRVQTILREECRKLGAPTRGELFDAMLRLAIAVVKQRGFSEARVRFIAEEFTK